MAAFEAPSTARKIAADLMEASQGTFTQLERVTPEALADVTSQMTRKTAGAAA